MGWLQGSLRVTSGHPGSSSEHSIQADPDWRVWIRGRELLDKDNLKEGQKTSDQDFEVEYGELDRGTQSERFRASR